jgi:tetratricopeptide (TPR) repeat protein
MARTVLLALAISALATPGAGQPAKDTPARAKQAYDRAVALEDQGNYAAALSLLWEASGLAPRDPDIQNRLGEALERIGALDAAIDAYRQALAARPTFRQASNNLILALVKSGNGPEAIERARALVAEAPADPDRYFTLGLAQSEQDVEAAIATFRKVLELNPQHTLARYNLALVLRRADRLLEALDELQRIVATEPQAEAQYTTGIIHWHLGNLGRAASALRAAIALKRDYVDAHYALGGVLRAAGDLDGAAAALRRTIALRKDLPAAHYTLGLVLQQSGDGAGSRVELDEADRLRRRAEREHYALVATSVGIRKLQEGDLPGGLAQFTRAIEAFDEYAPAHYQRGLVLRRMGQEKAARQAFSRARELNPNLIPPEK